MGLRNHRIRFSAALPFLSLLDGQAGSSGSGGESLRRDHGAGWFIHLRPGIERPGRFLAIGHRSPIYGGSGDPRHLCLDSQSHLPWPGLDSHRIFLGIGTFGLPGIGFHFGGIAPRTNQARGDFPFPGAWPGVPTVLHPGGTLYKVVVRFARSGG